MAKEILQYQILPSEGYFCSEEGWELMLFGYQNTLCLVVDKSNQLVLRVLGKDHSR